MNRQHRGDPEQRKTLFLRLALGAGVAGCFFLLVYGINAWYEHHRFLPQKKILVELEQDPPAVSSSPGGGSFVSPSGKADEDLSFFQSLTQQKAPYTYLQREPRPEKQNPKPVPSAAEKPSEPSAPRLPEPVVENPKESPQSANTYAVQTGSFQNHAGAESLKNKLREKGFGSYITEAELKNGSRWYRVKVGNGLSRSEAEFLAENLRKRAGLKPLIVSEKE